MQPNPGSAPDEITLLSKEGDAARAERTQPELFPDAHAQGGGIDHIYVLQLGTLRLVLHRRALGAAHRDFTGSGAVKSPAGPKARVLSPARGAGMAGWAVPLN